MCLYIDETLHDNDRLGTKSKWKPRIAERDILVYKVLTFEEDTRAYSPYRGASWMFGKMKTAQKLTQAYYCQPAVEAGLHAFTDPNAAWVLANARTMYSRYNDNTDRVYPAIIPKGTEVFFGLKGDIVATKMVVFKDLPSLEAVYGIIADGVKKKLIAK